MSVLVAIPVKNRLDLTRPLVEALERDGARVLVMDNGSEDGTAEWAMGYETSRPSTRQYLDCKGMSLHEMWNRAIDIANLRSAHLAILNNDLELDGKPDWIGRLTAPFEQGWDVLCPNYDRRTDWRPIMPLQGICAGRYDGTGGLAGFAFVMSSGFLSTGYRFPEEAKWWFGDTDLARTLERDSRSCGMVIDVGVTHIGGGSQTAKDHDLSEQCLKDKEWFESKWGATCTIP